MSSSESTSSGGGFPSTVRISNLSMKSGGGGPAFVGQVFSMCDLSGTGLMAVSTQFDIPFLSKRTPQWLKKMFQAVMKSERNGPVFQFFIDLGDAVSYVKKLSIPSGVVGACRLDLAYEHFKEKPHMFQFIPNERQVKEANKLLKNAHNTRKKRVEGVPVFTAQNLDIAIATADGIKWYTPYFFNKSMLDDILEDSVDQHFNTLIQTRHLQRRRDIIDDNMASDLLDDSTENVWEPPEVQEVMDEIGTPSIPLSVITKAAEIQLLYTVDKVLLGNRWLRKATGIQPKFPYVVDSFEKRSAASFQRASRLPDAVAESESDSEDKQLQHYNHLKPGSQSKLKHKPDFHYPFGEWFANPWLKPLEDHHNLPDSRKETSDKDCLKEEPQPNPFLPKITMVGVATGEAGPLSKATLKKTMDDLTKELEDTDQGNTANGYREHNYDDGRDPLFVANVGDYYSGLSKASSARWVRPRSARS
nr:Tic22-like protein [Tanacetum cinerariifolium]